MRPTALAAKSSPSPAYNPIFPITLATDGAGVPLPVGPGGGALPGDTPTPNANAPAVTWPSVSETTRQLTVNTPFGRSEGRGIWSCFGSPSTAAAGPASTRSPA